MQHTAAIEALVIRRSSNVNAFGLRGIWIITTAAGRVFEFAVNQLDAERYQIGEIVRVPFWVTAKGEAHAPAHELARQIGVRAMPASLIPAFLRDFSAELADKWESHKSANAIPAIPATDADKPSAYVSTVGTYSVREVLSQPE